MKKLNILVLVVCMAVINGFATIYYVAPYGNDANDGLSTNANHAWLTEQPSQHVVVPGDTVYFRGGVYTNMSFGAQGTASQPITYRNYPGEKPIIVVVTNGYAPVALDFGVCNSILHGFTTRGGDVGIRLVGNGYFGATNK